MKRLLALFQRPNRSEAVPVSIHDRSLLPNVTVQTLGAGAGVCFLLGMGISWYVRSAPLGAQVLGCGWGALAVAAPDESASSGQQVCQAQPTADMPAESAANPIGRDRLPLAADIESGLALLDAVQYADQFRYNVIEDPPFSSRSGASEPSLSAIVDGVQALLTEQGYPIAPVSISLVDLTGPCCDYAQYQDEQPRYPASVVKLFWLVALYGQYDAGILQPDTQVVADDEALMAHYSNNGASSRVLDAITGTESGDVLEPDALTDWLEARNTVNTFFLAAHYPDLNIAHKTFPIPDLGLSDRTGRERQFTEGEFAATEKTPSPRNYLTTYTAARLLYEIDTGQAIAPHYSDRIKQHLRHSTDPAMWQSEDNNAIAGFFGEYLPPDTELYTKLGFTFDDGRQEAAIIASADGQTRFILVVFANDPIYSQIDSTAFPAIARYVYDEMRRRRPASALNSEG